MRTLEKLCQAALEDGDPSWNQTVLDEKASAEDILQPVRRCRCLRPAVLSS